MTTRRAQEGTMERRARWHESGESSWLLKMPIRDGGAVLAIVTYDREYRWTTYTTPVIVGSELTLGAAKRAVRKELRDATDQAGG